MKKYSKPELLKIGNVMELTKGGSGSSTETWYSDTECSTFPRR